MLSCSTWHMNIRYPSALNINFQLWGHETKYKTKINCCRMYIVLCDPDMCTNLIYCISVGMGHSKLRLVDISSIYHLFLFLNSQFSLYQPYNYWQSKIFQTMCWYWSNFEIEKMSPMASAGNNRIYDATHYYLKT